MGAAGSAGPSDLAPVTPSWGAGGRRRGKTARSLRAKSPTPRNLSQGAGCRNRPAYRGPRRKTVGLFSKSRKRLGRGPSDTSASSFTDRGPHEFGNWAGPPLGKYRYAALRPRRVWRRHLRAGRPHAPLGDLVGPRGRKKKIKGEKQSEGKRQKGTRGIVGGPPLWRGAQRLFGFHSSRSKVF